MTLLPVALLALAAQGEPLAALAEHQCLTCHGGAPAALDVREAPRLAGIGQRVHGAWLAAFLADPRGTRAHTTHPHELAALEPAARAAVAADLAAFLTQGAAPETTPSTASAAELERGRRLFHTVGCVACHVPEEPMEDLEWTLADWRRFKAEAEAAEDAADEVVAEAEEPTFIPPGTLAPGDQPIPRDLARKYSRATLAAFLADPLAVRPSGHMPDMALGAEDAGAIAAYLLRDLALGDSREARGLLLTAETLSAGKSAATPADLPAPASTVTRVVSGVDIEHRPADERFALRYDGILSVPADGEYTFHLRSDDGSWLDIDGVRLIDNGGDHAPTKRTGRVTLGAGAHTFGLVMYENSGGEELELLWEAGGAAPAPIPAEAFTHWALGFPGLAPFAAAGDPVRGAAAFRALGCAACHTDVAVPAEAATGLSRPRVCVGGDGARFMAPDAPRDRAALARAAAAAAALADDPAARVAHVLEARSCLQCHRRGDVGGVHPERKPYFLGDERAELGDEGRYPPHLTAIGRKLNDKALLMALDAAVRVRPYTTTRMPRFGIHNVGGLASDLAGLDRPVAAGVYEPDAPPALPDKAVALGRRLAGTQDGLGCVQCHDFLGTPSLGVRAVDLGAMYGRVRWPWFRDLLLDPTSVNMNSRMTAVFVDGKSPVHDVYGGDPEQQVAALWAFLQQGSAMAPPPGIRTGEAEYEVEPLDRVRMVGVFMRDVSPKVLCVGTPEGVHFAWDLENARLAKAWSGRFLNARGTWEGRAGALESPPSNDVLDLPPGPAIAFFPTAEAAATAPWPSGATAAQARTFNTEERTFAFLYEVEGVGFQEVVHPMDPLDGTGHLGRILVLSEDRGDAYARLARGARITAAQDADGPLWRVEGAAPHTVRILQGALPSGVSVVEIGGAQELRAQLPARASFFWTVQW